MHGVKMMGNLNVSNLLNIYENEISKSVRNKRKLYDFEINKMQYIEDIIKMLKNGLEGHKHYNIFLIYEPKCRLVMSLSVKDKVINHFVTRYVLEKKLTKYLNDRNVATRKGMGTDYAIKLVIRYMNKLKLKNNVDIPLYEYGKGLPIGNMTSQFLSIYYLNKLDHFIVNDLKLKYYVRYMDDFIILDSGIN